MGMLVEGRVRVKKRREMEGKGVEGREEEEDEK